MAWISYHIYYHDDMNILIKDNIAVLISILEKLNIINGYFFLRYWIKGPHLRLRIRITDDFHKLQAEHLVNTTISDYLKNNPSNTVIKAEQYFEQIRAFAKFENEKNYDVEFISNNSVIKELYIPENKKYGGEIGVRIAEDVFIVSSEIVMNFLANENISKNKTYFIAILYMLTGCKAFKFSIKKTLQFFNLYYQYWERYLPVKFIENRKENLDRIYQENKSELTKIYQYFNKINKAEDCIKNQSLQKWWNTLELAQNKIRKNMSYIKTKIYLAENSLIENHLLINYIHTHNNRFGVFATEEAILGYLIYATIKDCLYYGD